MKIPSNFDNNCTIERLWDSKKNHIDVSILDNMGKEVCQLCGDVYLKGELHQCQKISTAV